MTEKEKIKTSKRSKAERKPPAKATPSENSVAAKFEQSFQQLCDLHPYALHIVLARALLRLFPLLARRDGFDYLIVPEHESVKHEENFSQSKVALEIADPRVLGLFTTFYPVLVLLHALEPEKRATVTDGDNLGWFVNFLEKAAANANFNNSSVSGAEEKNVLLVMQAYQVGIHLFVHMISLRSKRTTPAIIKIGLNIAKYIHQLEPSAPFHDALNVDVDFILQAADGPMVNGSSKPNVLQQLAAAQLWSTEQPMAIDKSLILKTMDIWHQACDQLIRGLREGGEERQLELQVVEQIRADYDFIAAMEPQQSITDQRVKGKLSAETSSGSDELNRGNIAAQLAVWLCHEDNYAHQTIGILGHWGVGKTYFIDLVKKSLNDHNKTCREKGGDEYLLGEFNAWAYEYTENIQAGLAHEVLQALTTKPPHYTGVRRGWWYLYRLYLIWKFSVATQGPRILVLVWGLLAVTVAAVNTNITFWLNLLGLESLPIAQAHGFKLIATTLFSGGVIAAAWTQLRHLSTHALAKELKTYIKLPSYAQNLGDIPIMQQQIKTLCRIRLADKRRLLFVVDDLDRCGPEGIVKTLEAVRLVLDIPRVIVVIAVDERIALAALALHYTELAEHHHHGNARAIARDYLAKIIHLPITLNEPDNPAVQKYLSFLWEDKEDEDFVWVDHISVKQTMRDAETSRTDEEHKPTETDDNVVNNRDDDKESKNNQIRKQLFLLNQSQAVEALVQ